MRVCLVGAAVLFGNQGVEHDRAEAAARHSADRKNVVGEIWIRVLKPAQNNSGPVRGPDTTSLCRHDIERMRGRKFLDQRVPLFKSGNDTIALDGVCWNCANSMVVVPKTEDNREHDKTADDWELPTGAQEHQKDSEHYPRRGGEEENGPHSNFWATTTGATVKAMNSDKEMNAEIATPSFVPRLS